MIVYYKDKKLQSLSENPREAIKKLGKARARQLQKRLEQLRSAENLSAFICYPQVRCHEWLNDKAGRISVDLDHPYRLLFIPANDPIPLKEDGGLDWSRVTEIEIVDILDPH